jgi:hypothetical protein
VNSLIKLDVCVLYRQIDWYRDFPFNTVCPSVKTIKIVNQPNQITATVVNVIKDFTTVIYKTVNFALTAVEYFC